MVLKKIGCAMTEFFKGWKRKVGGITLVLACAFAALWMRSRSIQDTLTIETGRETSIKIVSAWNCLIFVQTEVSNPSQSFRVQPWTTRPLGVDFWEIEIHDLKAPWDVSPFKLGYPRYEIGKSQYSAVTWQIPYWFLTIPLSVAAAWLILSKPKAAALRTIQERRLTMFDYFNSMRRKFGIVTLIIACLFAGWWMRSFVVEDTFTSPIGVNRYLYVWSFPEACSIAIIRTSSSDLFETTPHWETNPIVPSNSSVFDDTDFRWNWNFRPFALGFQSDPNNEIDTVLLLFPLWAIILPVTLLSGWLLLSRCRLNNSQPVATHGPPVR